ncbi:GapA-binding peptide SR1P [Cerasibacillus quisquiliarum]
MLRIKGEVKVGTIICKDCQKIVEHYEANKVTTLYGQCSKCQAKK